MQPVKEAGVAGGAQPPRPDWTIDQDWEAYTAADHSVWKVLYDRQSKLLPGRACDEFVDGMRRLAMDPDTIPDFRRLNDVMMKRTGWQVVAVPGLVPDEVFFEHLANRRFPAGRFIRSAQQLDYIEQPDVFHDVFGHVPMLIHPVFADYMQAYGEGGLRAQKLGVLQNLARVYWYTVEFGLIGAADRVRIYGSGIVSSFAETRFSLDDASPNRIRFDVERVMRTQYHIDDFQETYFVIGDFDELLELARIDFGPLYEHVKAKADIDPGEILDSDAVISRGTRAYHNAKRAGG